MTLTLLSFLFLPKPGKKLLIYLLLVCVCVCVCGGGGGGGEWGHIYIVNIGSSHISCTFLYNKEIELIYPANPEGSQNAEICFE